MLEPSDRQLLLESLRPPLGHRLDHALGTTFTLDLLALLTAPMAFTLFDLETEDGQPSADPVALLRAVREHGDRITIFCQGGQIAVPPHDQLLYANLEDCVYQVVRKGALFHPKLWLLRFTPTGPGPVLYRLLCLSRNLTFDRSWDTVLRLDGELATREHDAAVNRPLADFVGSLAKLPLRPGLPKDRAAKLAEIDHELGRVVFAPPDGFSEIRFWPLGVDGHRASPFQGDIRRMLVVSPFLGADALERLAGSGGDHVLVSRLESLDRLPRATLPASFADVRVMDEAAAFEPARESAEEAVASADDTHASPGETLRGLHAKVYVADRGRRASVWVGSANATGAALGRNVELLIELCGTVGHCGVEAVLAGKVRGGHGFASLLAPYDLDAEPAERDLALEQLEADVEQVQLALARERLVLDIEKVGDESGYAAELLGPGPGRPAISREMRISAWPITRNPAEAKVRLVPSKGSALARFEGLVATTITPFVAFEIEASRVRASHAARFVLRLPLRGAPRGRHEDVLRSLLSDREKILRYLLLILAQADSSALVSELIAGLKGAGPEEADSKGLDLPLLEGMLKALERDPDRLEQVASLLADLGDGEARDALLPEAFGEIWEPIWAARRVGRT